MPMPKPMDPNNCVDAASRSGGGKDRSGIWMLRPTLFNSGLQSKGQEPCALHCIAVIG